MVVWHVTTVKKLGRYTQGGRIMPPVRAWETIEQAERFSLSTGRRVILRLRFPDNAPKLEGHFNQARVMDRPVKLEGY